MSKVHPPKLAWYSVKWASCPPKIEGITIITACGRGDITNKYVHKQLPTCLQHPPTPIPSHTGHFPTPQTNYASISLRTISSHSSKEHDDQNCIFCTTVPNPTKTQHTSAMSVVGHSPGRAATPSCKISWWATYPLILSFSLSPCFSHFVRMPPKKNIGQLVGKKYGKTTQPTQSTRQPC